jgi:photosystem II stability/assembly factor-like uncharacterized protein
MFLFANAWNRLGINLLPLALVVVSLSSCGDDIQTSLNKKTEIIPNKSEFDPKSTSAHAESVSEFPFSHVASLAFVGSDRIWLVAPDASALLRSEDGGVTWQKLSIHVTSKKSVISFVTQDKGWLVANVEGKGEVWLTTDGGGTWTKVGTILRNNGAEPFLSPVQLEFVDDSHGWLIETLGIWRTEDGGVSWREVLSTDDPRLSGQPGRGFFKSQLEAWISGGKGQVYQTADGGNTWKIQTADDNSEFLDIFFVDDHTGWVSRNYRGQLYRTDDAGASWHLQPQLTDGTYIESCYFLSKDEGWAIGQHLLPGSEGLMPFEYMAKGLVRAVLLHTLDGGRTWQEALTAKTDPFFVRLHFHGSVGWLLSHDSLYRTSDAGRSWQVVLQSLTAKR